MVQDARQLQAIADHPAGVSGPNLASRSSVGSASATSTGRSFTKGITAAPLGTVVEKGGDSVIQAIGFRLRQVQLGNPPVNDLHYRYDYKIGGNAQPNENLHITVNWTTAFGGLISRRIHYNYATGAWTWRPNAPTTPGIAAEVVGQRADAIQWAAEYHRNPPANEGGDGGEVPENNLMNFPAL